MSKLNKPTKTNLRKVGSTVSNNQRTDEAIIDERKRKIDEILNAQQFVDNWNNEYVGKKGMDEKDLVSHFNNIQLSSGMIIQMYMENPIKELVRNENGEVISLNFSLQQIDNRTRNTDKPNWVTTPFPVIDKGVIMAISPAMLNWYHQEKQMVKNFNPEAAEKFVIPQVGDIVYTNHFMFKDSRYYVDKQAKCEDFVKSQEEVRLNNFDFLFKVTNYEIESIVRPDKKELMLDNKSSKETVINTEDLRKDYTEDGE